MKSALSHLELLRPASRAEALQLLRDEEGLVPLAGATDLYVGLNFGTLSATRFLDLSRLRGLRLIRQLGDTLSIGALATYTRILRSHLVKSWLPMLQQAAREVGGVQIQNRGTIGGNLANASPAGDTLPVLAAAEAVIVLQSAAGKQRVRFSEFYTGYRQSVRRSDQLIVAVEVPRVRGAQWFRKVGTRAAQAVSKVVLAAVRGPAPRVAIGSVAPTVLRLPRTEALLAAGAPLDQAVRALEEEIQPIDDFRSTAEYRRRVAGNLLRRFWAETAPATDP